MNSEIKYIVDKNIVSLRLDRALTLLNKILNTLYKIIIFF